MNATELMVNRPDQAAAPAGVWFCGKCRRVWSLERDAERCCTCSYCGKELAQNENFYHYACMRAERDKRRAEKLASAAEVADHDGWVYCEAGGPRDGYAENLKAMAEWWQDRLDSGACDPSDYPSHVFCCVERPPRRIDPSDLLEMVAGEGCDDMMDDVVVPDLLVEWLNKINKCLSSYDPDYKRKVRMPTLARPEEQISRYRGGNTC